MGTVIVVVGGMFLCFLASSVVSIALTAASGAAFSAGSAISKGLGVFIAAVIASLLGLTWTAAMYLFADRLAREDYAVSWVIWLMAVLAAALPIGQALDSGRKTALIESLTEDQRRLGRSLEVASWVQLGGMLLMFFSSRALDWWRWLPI